MERFIVEIFRAKDDRFLGPFTTAQVIAFGFVVVDAALLKRLHTVAPGRPGILAPSADPEPRPAS